MTQFVRRKFDVRIKETKFFAIFEVASGGRGIWGMGRKSAEIYFFVGSGDTSTSGFTLVEVMMAMGLIAVLALSIATTMTGAFKQEGKLQAKQVARDFNDEIRFAVNLTNCGIPSLPIPSLIATKGDHGISVIEGRGSAFAPGQNYGKMQIKDIRLTPFRDPSTAAREYAPVDDDNAESAFIFRAHLVVNTDTTIGTEKLSGESLHPVLLTLDSTRSNIQGCRGIGEVNALVATCAALNGTLNPDFTCDLPCPDGNSRNADGKCYAEPPESVDPNHLAVNELGKGYNPPL